MSFFPEKLPEVISENLRKLSIQHLLTMTTGIHDNTYGILYPQKDWVKAFLAQELPHEPGTYYRYSTHASHMLAAIIEKTTGESLLHFLNKHLFEPLGISKPQWETCPMGIVAGGMGLRDISSRFPLSSLRVVNLHLLSHLIWTVPVTFNKVVYVFLSNFFFWSFY